MADSSREMQDPHAEAAPQQPRAPGKAKSASADDKAPASKRRCVSTACIACRRRKSKCDGNLPSCAACSSVYHTTCIYDPNSDHRRKGVYRKDTGTVRTARNTTLQTIIQAILNYGDEEEAFELVRQIRSCDNLEDVAESIVNQEKGQAVYASAEPGTDEDFTQVDRFESELAYKVSELVLDGSRKFIGGTSNLIFLPPGSELSEVTGNEPGHGDFAVVQWTNVTNDEQLISHLMTMYFTWHYPFFTTLSKDLFYRDYIRGISSQYCSSLLVNTILALGCHFSSREGAFQDPHNSATAGDHFFKEAKRLVLANDEHENAKLCTVQALALMSVREAGCGREGKGWIYSGMSFRMASDLGLNLDVSSHGTQNLDDDEIDARRITFWGCYLFDKCWSNYMGRQPQLTSSNSNVPKIDVLPNEEAELWSPYTDAGADHERTQPSRTRNVALQISKLSEISGDLLIFFYLPPSPEKPLSKQLELKKLSEIHTRLEAWKKGLPHELEPKEGQLPQVLVMHMFYQLLLIHLYRPFLKYTRSTSPLPQHVSPRRLCTQAASAISKLLRMYKRTYGFQQICNIAVYIAHTACTIHLLNLPEKNAQRDIIHGLRNLEEMAEGWLCARRTLRILDISANKWQVPLPQEASITFERTHTKWGSWGSWDQPTSPSAISEESPPSGTPPRMPATTIISSSSHPAVAQQSNYQIPPIPTGLAMPMTSQYQQGTPIPASIPATQPMSRPVNIQRQRTDNRFLPEPTYLRPVPHILHPVQPVLFTQHDAWYDPNAVDNQQTCPSAGTDASPLTGFDSSNDLVEESQDWWARNYMGIGNWEEGWNGITGAAAAPPPPPPPPQSSHMQTPAGNSGEVPSQTMDFPVQIPAPELRQGANPLFYGNMGCPQNSQPDYCQQ